MVVVFCECTSASGVRLACFLTFNMFLALVDSSSVKVNMLIRFQDMFRAVLVFFARHFHMAMTAFV